MLLDMLIDANYHNRIVTRRLKNYPLLDNDFLDQPAIARQYHAYTSSNNRGAVGDGVFCAVLPDGIKRGLWELFEYSPGWWRGRIPSP
jgi:hypothetical protein